MRREIELDPAVAAVLGDGQRRAQQRKMTPAQRKRAARDSARQRVTMEMDPRIVSLVQQIADAEKCSPASVATILLKDALARYAADEIGLGDNLRSSRSPRYEWVVDLGDLSALGSAVKKRLKRDGCISDGGV